MKGILRIFCVALIILMILPTAVSCHKKGDNKGTSDLPAVTTGDSPYDENGYLRDDIPDELDYAGKEVNILHWSDAQYIEFGETDTSSVVSSAIFDRNNAVESRLGVKLVWYDSLAGDGVYKQFTQKVEMDIYSEQIYDIYAAYAPELGMLTTFGYTKNLLASDMKYLNLEKPWWPKSLTEYCSFGDKLYFASGDISTNLFYVMNGIYYNQNMLNELHVTDDPYEMVKNGTWTVDALLRICMNVGEPGYDGTVDSSKYGLITAWALTDGFFVGSGLETIVKNPEGEWTLSDNFSSSKAHTLYTKLGNLWNSDDAYIAKDNKFSVVFPEGRSLFLAGQIGYAVSYFGEADFTYRVVPYPKFDKEQEKYYTAVGNYFSMYGVSTNCSENEERAERLSAVLECYASEAYRKTTPALFETTFKTRYSEDEKMAEMFDTIREGVRFDLGQMHGAAIGLPYNTIRDFIYTGGSEFSSTIARTAYAIKKNITDLGTKYKELP